MRVYWIVPAATQWSLAWKEVGQRTQCMSLSLYFITGSLQHSRVRAQYSSVYALLGVVAGTGVAGVDGAVEGIGEDPGLGPEQGPGETGEVVVAAAAGDPAPLGVRVLLAAHDAAVAARHTVAALARTRRAARPAASVVVLNITL